MHDGTRRPRRSTPFKLQPPGQDRMGPTPSHGHDYCDLLASARDPRGALDLCCRLLVACRRFKRRAAGDPWATNEPGTAIEP